MTVLTPVQKERMDAATYLELVEKDRKNIKKARFVPPQIGKKGFGFFEVEYVHSKLVESNG